MNRREFIIGSSAAVATAAVVGIPAALPEPIYFGADFGSKASLSFAIAKRNGKTMTSWLVRGCETPNRVREFERALLAEFLERKDAEG